ncbi:M48 family metallopeptidase [Kaistella flava (ex Peng et al. 2021)]|uniref:M48 family metallopeptidase n=1 Tax=Kaistella flava (ex Peng et al. 2021) TaxID=2038776 RepID=A0A7M2YC85_9FLAO|nr:M48 family metallopeptidase [Kaistella flava (ex Peng et al. 2021)]QOW11265.1 M48 family metallopeptidase [Kaistella flava (ex Peng et al. 2021)]
MNKLNKFLGITALSVVMVACTTNPITGRSSLQLANNQEITAMALQQYKQALSEAKVIKGTTAAKSVQNVGLRIKNAANNYYRGIGREADLVNYQWEFNLLDDKQINAWCMPGGKVAVYSGILPITKTDAGLAVVLGHEISHALAGHGNERISQGMIAEYGGAILGSTISNGQLAAIFQQAYPIGAQVALLKYGRSQELEADEMGLYLMSMAGYDPREAQPFWQRMEVASTGNRPPEFLSTHPNPDTRRADLEKHMSKALEYYRAAGGKV